ncbi:MAG: hypothetical protein ABRQ38_10490 [Candidatus Eremiobacterota bacterium]
MNFVRKIVSSDILADIIEIPDSMKHRDVEIIILPLEFSEKQVNTKVKQKNARGLLKKYKNTELISRENSAWADAVKEKYANS